MNKIKQIFGGDARQLGMIFALVALIILFQILTGGLTLQPDNVNNIIQGNAYILVLAIGMVLVIIAGHIDLSVGSVAAFVGIVVAIAMRDWGVGWPIGILLGLALGALVGAWQGMWTAYVGIPAFIVTLAGMLFFRGANQFVGKSNTVPVPEGFQQIGAGTLPEVGPNTGYNNLTVLLGVLACVGIIWGTLRGRRQLVKIGATVEDAWVTYTRMSLICLVVLGAMMLIASGRKGFPIPGLILIALVLIYGFIATKTVVGRHIYAVGGNRHAAELSGVRSKRVNFLVMANMSVLAALAGMMFVARSERLRPLRRRRLGARRHRRGVHRRRRGQRRRRHRHRLDRRRSRHGGAQQRSPADGCRRRHDPDDQGSRPARRRRLRRLQQVAGQAVDHGLVHAQPRIEGIRRRRGRRRGAQCGVGDLEDRRDHRHAELTAALSPHPHTRVPPGREQKGNMHMRLFAKVVGVTAVAALALTGCGRTSDSGSGGGSGSTGGASTGFAANATIGVALPQKTSENWVLAEGLFNDGLKAAGFKPDVQFANGGVSEQQNQIQAMITKQAKVIVIGAIDGAQLGTQVKAAKDSGAIVIAYDRLLKNTADVDYYIAYDNRKVGQLQGQALLDGMKAKKPNGPYNIELFAGSPDDANAQVFFDGAMDVLKPKIDDGTLKVPSGQTTLQPGRHPGLEGRERAEADGHAPVGQLQPAPRSTACCPRTTPSLGRSSPRSRRPVSPSRSSPVRTPRSSR